MPLAKLPSGQEGDWKERGVCEDGGMFWSPLDVRRLALLLLLPSCPLAAESSCSRCCSEQGAWEAYIEATKAHVSDQCSLAFEGASPGMCCGAHPVSEGLGCCPAGGTCIQCASSWRCSHERVVTSVSRCSICASDKPNDCYTMWWSQLTGGPFFFSELVESLLFLLLLVMCIGGGGIWSYRRRRIVVMSAPNGGSRPIRNNSGALAGRAAVAKGAPVVHGSVVGSSAAACSSGNKSMM